MKRRIISMLMALALCLSLVPAGALAVEDGAEETAVPAATAEHNPVINLSEITGVLYLRTEGEQLQYATDSELTQNANFKNYTGSITLTGENTSYGVNVYGGEHNVTLKDATLTGHIVKWIYPALYIQGGASVNLTLVGKNSATAAAEGSYGIAVDPGASLTITPASTGSLTANGGNNKNSAGSGAGIGGGGDITIKGGTIIAKGGDYGAGIGVEKARGGVVTITGGNVTATGGDYGAGIGGTEYSPSGSDGSGGTIKITGGTVTATGGQYGGAGIGDGDNGSAITIEGGNVTATGNGGGAGIGGGSGGIGGSITIKDGTVTATGSSYSAGIGGGNAGNGGEITIEGGTVTATGGADGAGIGGDADGGTITIRGGEITANGGANAAGIGGGGFPRNDKGGRGGTIVITGGTVKATGSGGDSAGGGAGIGGGSRGDGGTITIGGGTVIAKGGDEGAGIGGGSNDSGGEITITGGTVTAEGGTVTTEGGDEGAGIGGGSSDSGCTVVITGGNVQTDRISVTPTDGEEKELQKNILTLEGVTENVPVTALAGLTGVESYGLEDVTTLDGKLYFWLPEGGNVRKVTAGENLYVGSLDAASRAGTYTIPTSVADVTIGSETKTYNDLVAAFASVKAGDTATITLLGDATLFPGEKLTVSGDVTLVDNGHTLSGAYTSDGDGLINIPSGAKLTITNATITNDEPSSSDSYAVFVSGGTLVIDGGTITATSGSDKGVAVYVDAGTAELSGGTFCGGISGKDAQMKDFLKIGYAYQQNGVWVKDAAVNQLTGTVTVAKAPIQSVSVSPATTTTIPYGDTGPTLTAKAELAENVSEGDVTYQWYQDGVAIENATSSTYTPGKLDANEDGYQFTCVATADGYSLTSKSALVKVDQREAELTITGTTTKTYDGTTDGPAGLSVGIENAVSEDNVTVTAESYTYNSANVEEANTITANGVTLSGDDAGNYKLPEGAITTEGKITKSQPTIAFRSNPLSQYGQAFSYTAITNTSLTISGASADDVVFIWADSEQKPLDAEPTDAGTYTLIATIPATDNTEMATASTTATIQPKPVSNPTITLSPNSYEYNGTARTPEVTVMDGTTKLDTSEYIVTYSNNTNVGTATVTITNNEGGNYEVSETTASFEITKPDLATATVTLTLPDNGYAYDGTAKEPGVTVIKDERTLEANKDYTVTYAENTNAGTATVTVTAVENGNYIGSRSVEFTIERATPNLGTVGYTGTIFPTTALADIALTRTVDTVPGTLALDAGQTLTVGEGTYHWTFTPDDADNYNEVTGTVTLEVTKDSLTGISIGDTAPDKTDYAYEDAFDTTGLTVTATYASGNTADVTDKVTFGALSVGDISIELSYTEDGVTVKCTVTGITVAKKQLDVSGMNWSEGTYTYNGTAQGPVLTGTLPTGVEAVTTGNSAVNAGAYTAKAEFTLAEGYSDANYEIVGNDTSLTAEWSIFKAAAPTVAEQTVSHVRTQATDGTLDLSKLLPADRGTSEYTLTSTNHPALSNVAVNRDSGLLTYTTTTPAAETTDTITVTVTMGNYENTTIKVKVNLVDKTPVTITGVKAAEGLTYTGRPQPGYTGTPTSENYTGPYTITYTGDGYNSTTAPTNAGEYTVTIAVPDSDETYAGSVSLNFTIEQAVAVVTAVNQTIDVGGQAPDLSNPTLGTHYTVTGLLGSDGLTTPPTLAYYKDGAAATPDTTTIGTYTITPSGANADGNYAISYGKGTLYIKEVGTEVVTKINQSELKAVPSELSGKFSSVEALQAELTKVLVSETGYSEDRVATYDVELQFSLDGGNTWITATEDNFPQDGLTVMIDYPDGTGRTTHDFVVSHMFTTTSPKLGTVAGDTEKPTVTKLADGLQVTLKGLSPVSVAWKTIPTGGGSGGTATYPVTVTAAQGGSVQASPTQAAQGTTVTLTVTHDQGYQLTTLTATDAKGNEVTLTEKGNGQYTFAMPASKVTVAASFAKTDGPCDGGADCPSHHFTDVDPAQWYHSAVDYMVTQGLMNGTAPTKFAPNETTTRAMIVTILYRLAGEPAVDGGTPFTDVKSDQWYTDAITWAATTGVVNGVTPTTFEPNAAITREQLAAMLWRYAGSPSSDHSLDAFTDAGQISGYAKSALAWANETHVVNGKGNGRLDPAGNATRAEAAQMLKNFLES